MELSEFDPYRAIGGHTPFSEFMIRQRGEQDLEWKPALEAFHTYDDMVLRYEIAGVDPDDIDIRVEGRVLHVSGIRRRTEEIPEELLMRDERRYGAFERSIVLAEGAGPEQVRASYRHGLLEIRVAHNRRREATVVPDCAEGDPVPLKVRTAHD